MKNSSIRILTLMIIILAFSGVTYFLKITNDYQTEIVKLKDALSESQVAHEKLLLDYSTMDIELNSYEDQVSELRNQLEDQENDLQVYRNIIEGIKDELTLAKSEIEEFESGKMDTEDLAASDPFYYLRLSEEDYSYFNDRERYIMSMWNQLAKSDTGLGFDGVFIGSDISTLLSRFDSGIFSYEASEEHFGVEGLSLTTDYMDINFVGTRVESIFVHYYRYGDARYSSLSQDELFDTLKVDYSNYKVSKTEDLIIVCDNKNGIEMQFAFYDDDLTILIKKINWFE